MRLKTLGIYGTHVQGRGHGEAQEAQCACLEEEHQEGRAAEHTEVERTAGKKDEDNKWPDRVMIHGPWFGFHLLFDMAEFRQKNNTV